jgi:hypothetical protein
MLRVSQQEVKAQVKVRVKLTLEQAVKAQR